MADKVVAARAPTGTHDVLWPESTRWEALLALRLSQVEAGTWPPPVRRVSWRELRAGDVLADPDRDVLVEVAETTGTRDGGERTTIWYRAPQHDGLYSRSAPAGCEVPIRPRDGDREEDDDA